MTFRIGARALYEQATIAIPDGQKVGLVGRNGTGKTTLFRLIIDELAPDEGSININPKHKIGTVAQEAPAGPESLLDTVLAADVERSSLLAEAETATDPVVTDVGKTLAELADMVEADASLDNLNNHSMVIISNTGELMSVGLDSNGKKIYNSVGNLVAERGEQGHKVQPVHPVQTVQQVQQVQQVPEVTQVPLVVRVSKVHKVLLAH